MTVPCAARLEAVTAAAPAASCCQAMPGTSPLKAAGPEASTGVKLGRVAAALAVLCFGLALVAAPTAVLGGLLSTSAESITGAQADAVAKSSQAVAWRRLTSVVFVCCPLQVPCWTCSSLGTSCCRCVSVARHRRQCCAVSLQERSHHTLTALTHCSVAAAVAAAVTCCWLQGAGLLSDGAELLLEIINPGVVGGEQHKLVTAGATTQCAAGSAAALPSVCLTYAWCFVPVSQVLCCQCWVRCLTPSSS
jgi:hypothetical protein